MEEIKKSKEEGERVGKWSPDETCNIPACPDVRACERPGRRQRDTFTERDWGC